MGALQLFNVYLNQRLRNHATAIVWFILIAIVIYAFYCTARDFNFSVIANPFKLGCYK